MFADGSDRGGDPYNFAQNKKSLLGKILRIDVDHIPSSREINELGQWGNYSIPKVNPFIADKEQQPDIWALGFTNPRRCSFDAERPTHLLCGDAGRIWRFLFFTNVWCTLKSPYCFPLYSFWNF